VLEVETVIYVDNGQQIYQRIRENRRVVIDKSASYASLNHVEEVELPKAQKKIFYPGKIKIHADI
jgi:hypothetical protein